MKKWVTLLLVASMLLGSSAMAAVSTDSAMPVVDSPLEVSIAFMPQPSSVNFDMEKNWMNAYLEKESGLIFDWTIIDPASSEERISLMCNSGDLPDAILGYSFDSNKLVKYGVSEQLFMPLNELIAEYAPTLSALFDENPNWKSAVTATDGNIYGLPAFSNIWNYPLRFFINTAWLKNLGLENPSTLAELKETLTAFRDMDANGDGDAANEIPWGGSWSDITGFSERNLIFDTMGLVPISTGLGNIALDYDTENHDIVFVPYTSKYYDFLKYMNDLWTEGLLDPDMFTQNQTQVQAKVLEGNTGFVEMSAPYVYDPDHQADWESINTLVDNEGDTPVFPDTTGIFSAAMLVINADADEEAAAAIVNLCDFFYTLEGYGYATYGPEAGGDLDYFGTGHYYDAEKNTILYNMPADMTSAWVHRVTNLSFWNVPGLNQTGYDPYRLLYAQVYPDSAIGQQFKNGVVCRADETSLQEKQGPYYVDPVPNFFFSAEDLERLNELQTPLDDYVASMEAKFITGELDIDAEFANFTKTLEDYGVIEYMEIYSKYYALYQAN